MNERENMKKILSTLLLLIFCTVYGTCAVESEEMNIMEKFFKIKSLQYEEGSYPYPEITIEYSSNSLFGTIIYSEGQEWNKKVVKRKLVLKNTFNKNIYKIVQFIYQGYHIFPDNFEQFKKYFNCASVFRSYYQ